jgi:SAM-dependent methyltransferase
MNTYSSPFPDSAFPYIASVEDTHWWFRARNQIVIWVLRSWIRQFFSFLEVGCGTGYVISGIAKAFPNSQLEATEYFEEGLIFARRRVARCVFRQLDATTMTEAGTYDCIGSFDVIEHIEKDELVLSNLYRALRPNGHLLLTVPQHPWLWSTADESAHHVRRYTAMELRDKAQKAGFCITYCTSFVSLLLPLMLIQRLSKRNPNYNPDDEFKVSPFLNTALYLVMQVELTLLKLGLRFPAGGSLLLLARKP